MHRTTILTLWLAGCWISPGDWDEWDIKHGEFDTATPEGDTDTDVDADSDSDADADTDADTDAVCAEASVCKGSYSVENSNDMEALVLCSEVTASLEVQNQNWFSSFDLPCLTVIGENLTFRDNDAVDNLSASNLESIGGNLFVYNNLVQTTLELSSLVSVGGYLDIGYVDALTNCDLGSLQTVGGEFKFQNNEGMTAISLPSLVEVGGDLGFQSSQNITSVSLPELRDVDGHFTLHRAGEGLQVFDAPKLENVLGRLQLHTTELTEIELTSLRTVGESLSFDSNAMLESLRLPALELVSDSLVVNGHPALSSFEAPALTEAGALGLYENAALETVDCAALLSTDLAFLIRDNSALRSLEGLPNLTRVGDYVTISGNPELCQSEAEAFAAALTVSGTVTVEKNGTARKDCD